MQQITNQTLQKDKLVKSFPNYKGKRWDNENDWKIR